MTDTKTKKTTPGTRTLITGLVLLFATPVVYFILGFLISFMCPQTEYGSCSLEGGIQGVISLMIIITIWAIVALSVTIRGIVQLSKRR